MYSQLDQFSYLSMSNSRFFLDKEEQEEINSTSLTKPLSENSDEINREGTAASSSTRLEPQGVLRYEEEKDVDKKKDQKHDRYSSVVSPKEAASSSSSSSTRLELQELRKKEDVDKEQEKYDQPCLGDQSEVADDDDEGFKTPTSSDHKIPVISECPPAPKKSRPETSAKRKLSPKIHRTLQLDLSEEVESMFPPPIQEDDTSSNSKKARTTTDDEE